MFFARRSVASARLLLRNQQPHRFGSHAAHHAAPVNESFGRSFYVTVGTFASCYVIHRIHKATEESGSQSWISNLIQKWTPSEQVFEQRNAIRTAVMEKAARDRHLFASQGPSETYGLMQPEVSFHAVQPINLVAGYDADLSKVVAHYERKNQAIEEDRVARMKDGKVVSLYE